MVSDLLMNEAITTYARAKVDKSEDSGVESGNSFDHIGKIKYTFLSIQRLYDIKGSEASSEHSSHEENSCHKVNVQINNEDSDLEVSHL